MPQLKGINYRGNVLSGVPIQEITEATTLQPDIDRRLLAVTSGITITLAATAETTGPKIDIVAIEDCTVTYYTDSSTSESITLNAGDTVSFLHYNGWKYLGIRGAVWN